MEENKCPQLDETERLLARDKLRACVKESGSSQASFASARRVPLTTLERWLKNGPPNPVLDWIRMITPPK